MTTQHAILEARRIGRATAGLQHWLIRRVSLLIAPGERLALVGPSGSGKTVLLRALAYLDPLDEGELWWHGAPLRRDHLPQFRSRVVYLHQRPALIEGTVEENLRYPFQFKTHRHRRFDRGRIELWLAELGRDISFLQKASQDLSGGELQITALLRAMQLQPEILLLDEPTAALDPSASGAVEACIGRWHDQQRNDRSIVLVSHNLQQAQRMADRIVTIRSGQLLEE